MQISQTNSKSCAQFIRKPCPPYTHIRSYRKKKGEAFKVQNEVYVQFYLDN